MIEDIERILISEEAIIDKCKELATEIDNHYKEVQATPIIVGLLKGSIPFMSELVKRIQIPCELEFMQVSSYAGTKSTGTINIKKDLEISCEGQYILIVEDIVDTGRTLNEVVKLLKDRGATEVKIATLLDKKEGRVVELEADYIGFDIPNEFVVGYGLDYNQKYRNLPFVGILSPKVYE